MIRKTQPILSLASLYLLGHFLLLLNRGVYWDGLYFMTLLKERRFDILWAQLERVKVFSLYYVIRLLDYIPDPVFAIKFIAFFSWFIAGVAIYYILRNIINLPKNHTFFITSSFLLIPTFLVKVELSVIHYSICTMLFFAGVFFYFASEKSRGFLKQRGGLLISLILFFLSFFTNSYLVFYGGFLLTAYFSFRNKNKESNALSSLFFWTKRNILFVLLPIIFWVFRASLGKPYGPLANYNEFVFLKPGFFLAFIQDLWNSVVYGFFWPIIGSISILQRKIFAGLFIFVAIIVYFLSKKILNRDTENVNTYNPKPVFYLFSGAITFFLGIFPYIIVGKSPHIFGLGFGMRHALLLPFGSSLLVLGAIIFLIKEKLQWIMQVTMLSLFITFNIYSYYSFDMDWYRQKAIVRSLQENREIIQSSTLLINDLTQGFNYQGRTVGDDEYRSLVYEAFPKEQFKFAFSSSAGDGMESKEEILLKYNDFKDSYTLPYPKLFDPLTKVMRISFVREKGPDIMTVKEWLKLKRLELLSPKEDFTKKLQKDFGIKVTSSNL